MSFPGPLKVQLSYIYATMSLQSYDESQARRQEVSALPRHGLVSLPTAAMAFAVLMMQVIISHSKHVPSEAQHPTLLEVLGFPNKCISSMHLNQSVVEGLVSHHPRSGGDPRQHQSGSILAQRVICPTQPHLCGISTQSMSEHSAGHCTPGLCVSMCSTNRHQAQVASCLGLLSSPDASGQHVSQPGK